MSAAVDTVEAFLARGGQITKCPTVFAAHGWSPHAPQLTGPVSEADRKVHTYSPPAKDTLRSRPCTYDRADEDGRRKIMEGARRGMEAQQARARARRERLLAEWNEIRDVDAMAQRHGVSTARIREMLRPLGVSFARGANRKNGGAT